MHTPAISHFQQHYSFEAICEKCGKEASVVEKTRQYIEKERRNWQAGQKDLYIRKENTQLPFTIQYNGETNKVYIHFKRFQGAPKCIGSGYDKSVFLTYEWDGKEIHAKAVSKLDGPSKTAASRKEYELLSLLQDIPGVLKLKGGMAYKGRDNVWRASIILDYCSGGDLYEALFGGRSLGEMSVKDKCWVMHDVFCTILSMHQMGVCHRDLKLENIFLKWDKVEARWKGIVGDFGSACSIGDLKFKAIAGTAGYMAPECFDPALWGTMTEKIDAWSLGCMMELVFNDEKESDVFLESLINGLKNPEPSERLNVCEALDSLNDWKSQRKLDHILPQRSHSL